MTGKVHTLAQSSAVRDPERHTRAVALVMASAQLAVRSWMLEAAWRALVALGRHTPHARPRLPRGARGRTVF